jgi:5'(3')-deoxyribonucleotidase
MRLGLDLDGCLHDFVRSLRTIVAAKLHRPHFMLPEPTCWEFWTEWGLTFEQWKECFDQGVEDGTLFGRFAPLDHGIVHTLGAEHEIHIVTHRPIEAHSTTCDWLERWRIPYDSITFTDDKTMVPTDVFVDDKPENVRALIDHGVDALLFDRRWNRGANAVGLRRVGSWQAFRDYVKALEVVA